MTQSQNKDVNLIYTYICVFISTHFRILTLPLFSNSPIPHHREHPNIDPPPFFLRFLYQVCMRCIFSASQTHPPRVVANIQIQVLRFTDPASLKTFKFKFTEHRPLSFFRFLYQHCKLCIFSTPKKKRTCSCKKSYLCLP